MISLPNSVIRRTSDATPPTGAGGVPSLGDGDNAGILYPLGSIYKIPATRTARGLLVVTSAGALREGLHPNDSDVAATDEVVNIEADSGDLELIYIKNTTGSDIERGALVSWDGSGASPYDVVKTPGASAVQEVIGVALFTIPTDKCAWVARRGKVKVWSDLAWSVGDVLGVGTLTAGQAEPVTTPHSEPGLGVALVAATGGGQLQFVLVDCRS